MVYLFISRHHADETSPSRTRTPKRETLRNATRQGRGAYLLTLHLLWAAAAVGLYLADLAFNEQARAHLVSTDALAGFFGLFFTIASSTVLLLRWWFSGRILKRLGPIKALYMLPLALACVSLGLNLSAMLETAFWAVFWFAVVGKFFDYVLRYGLHKPAFMVLYQPLPVRQRMAAQTSVEGVADPLATLAVAGVLLAGGYLFPLDAVHVSRLLLAVTVLWLGTVTLMGRRYPRALTEAVSRRVFGAADITLRDQLSLSLVAKGLESTQPSQVIYCVELIERDMPEAMESILLGNLFRDEESLRLDALTRISRLRQRYSLDMVVELAHADPSPRVRAAAVLAWSDVAGDEALDGLMALLDDPDPNLAAAAMIGCLRHGGDRGKAAAMPRLLDLVRSPDPDKRQTAARILGQTKLPTAPRPLFDLLADSQPAVRIEALEAVAALGAFELLHPVLGCLEQRDLRDDAVRALARMGTVVLPDLGRALARSTTSARGRAGIVRAVAQMPGNEATEFLTSLLERQDVGLRPHVLLGLRKRGFVAQGPKIQGVLRLAAQEAGHAAWHLLAMDRLPAHPDMRVLSEALLDEAAAAKERFLVLVSFLLPQGAAAEVRHALLRGNSHGRAYAIEILDRLLPKDLARKLPPLFELRNDATRAAQLRAMTRLGVPDLPDLLTTLVLQPPGTHLGWTSIAALYVMGARPNEVFVPVLQSIQDHADPIVLETLTWALRRHADLTHPAPAGGAYADR